MSHPPPYITLPTPGTGLRKEGGRDFLANRTKITKIDVDQAIPRRVSLLPAAWQGSGIGIDQALQEVFLDESQAPVLVFEDVAY